MTRTGGLDVPSSNPVIPQKSLSLRMLATLPWSLLTICLENYRKTPCQQQNLSALFHRRNFTSLCMFSKYFNDGCSDELQALLPPRRKYPRQTPQTAKLHPKGRYVYSQVHTSAFCGQNVGDVCYTTPPAQKNNDRLTNKLNLI